MRQTFLLAKQEEIIRNWSKPDFGYDYALFSETHKLTGDTRLETYVTFIRKSEELQKITHTTSASTSYCANTHLFPLPQLQKKNAPTKPSFFIWNGVS